MVKHEQWDEIYRQWENKEITAVLPRSQQHDVPDN